MAHPIIQVSELASFSDWKQVFLNREVYVKDQAVRVCVWGAGGGDRSMTITKLDNALKNGAECERFYFDFPFASIHTLDHLLQCVDFSLTDLLGILDTLSFERGEPELFGATVKRSVEKGIRVFSPFHLDRLRPLNQEPKKWTVKHAIRVVVNGQYDRLKCTGRYTDDYAFDASVNCGQGDIQKPLPFIRSVIESPSGWRVYARDGEGTIGLSCHHFDNNEITVNLDASHAG